MDNLLPLRPAFTSIIKKLADPRCPATASPLSPATATTAGASFLSLTPESKPETLEFPLPRYSPPRTLDLVVVGASPAGLTVANRVSAAELSVCSIDPSPTSSGPTTTASASTNSKRWTSSTASTSPCRPSSYTSTTATPSSSPAPTPASTAATSSPACSPTASPTTSSSTDPRSANSSTRKLNPS